MSLRIITKPQQIQNWITERSGTPARRRGSETDLCINFDNPSADYEPISLDELFEAMKFHHLVMLVDQEAGKTFHRIYRHS
ncbi:MAG TPA: hypothetical protein VLZ12_10015 [Verrucomicrobiae bacterium]|nr:hypothetical protein [Verrucomicrobiae bacterium]